MSDLTKRQAAALLLFHTEGELTEGGMYELLWPLIQRPRAVTNGLLERGLVTVGAWWEGAGYELHLTDAGLDALAELVPAAPSSGDGGTGT